MTEYGRALARLFAIAVVGVAAAICAGCEGDGAGSSPDSQGGDASDDGSDGGSQSDAGDSAAGSDTALDADPTADTATFCPAGTLESLESGECMPIGPRECAQRDAWGACLLAESCPRGEYPLWNGTCAPVGPPCPEPPAGEQRQTVPGRSDCAPTWCEAGQLPGLGDYACAPVGVPDCALAAIDGRQFCDPTADEGCPAQSFRLANGACFDWAADRACWTGGEAPPSSMVGAFVAPNAAGEGADGSWQAPYPTVSAALGSGAEAVWLLPGDHVAGLAIDSAVAIRGTCPGQARLVGGAPVELPADVAGGGGPTFDAPAKSAALWVRDGGALTLSDLGIEPDGIGVVVTNGHAQLDRVHIRHAELAGAAAIGGGATLSIAGCEITETQLVETAANRAIGVGVLADLGGHVSIARSRLAASAGYGALAWGAGSELHADELRVVDTEPMPNGLFGRGFVVRNGARGTLRRSAILRNRDTAVQAVFQAELLVEDSLIADTWNITEDAGAPPEYVGSFGQGLAALGGSTVVARRTVLARNHSAAVSSFDAQSEMRLEGSWILDTQAAKVDAPMDSGRGVEVAFGGGAELVGCVVDASLEAGVSAISSGSRVDVDTSIIRGTRRAPGGPNLGDGIVASPGTELQVRRSLITDNGASAVFCDRAALTLEDSELSYTVAAEGGLGYGLTVQGDEATAAVSGASIRYNVGGGVLASLGAELELAASWVSDTAPTGDEDGQGGGEQGRGVSVQQGASARLEDVTVERSHEIGVFARLEGEMGVVSEGLGIRDVYPLASNGRSGRGIEVGYGSSVWRDVVVQGAPDVAIMLASYGEGGPGPSHRVERASLRGGGAGGLGIAWVERAAVQISDCIVAGVSGAGVFSFDAVDARVERSHIAGVQSGQWRAGDGRLHPDLGDGIVLSGGVGQVIRDCVLEGNARSGALMNDAVGELQRTVLRSNQFGVVLQGQSTLSDESNRFEQNTAEDVVSEGQLAVPPPPVPTKF